MRSTTTHSGTRIIADPLSPWIDSGLDPVHRDELRTLVTSTAPAPTRITTLQRHWGLTGASSQLEQWEALAETAAIDVAVSRMLEPHLDALGILDEAGANSPAAGTTWGVWAAEAPGRVVTATTAADGSVRLSGEKAWCSLAAQLSHAIVIARSGDRGQACAVDLSDPRVQPWDEQWPALGLAEIPSGAVTFDHAPAQPVGPPDWYLERPSFAWGGIRVAACWFGGALGLARSAAHRHLTRPSSPLGSMTLGQLDLEVATARSVLAHAAAAADGPDVWSRDDAWTLALRARTIVYRSAQRIQQLSRELAGPAALTGGRAFAKADADLTVYLSQHHGPRDEAALGDALAAAGQK